MVKHGLFGLGLVRAETGKLYPEHGEAGGNEIYAEVEPDDEFYLQLRSDAPEMIYADLRVDGTLIQKGHRVRPGVTSRVGVIQAIQSVGGAEHTTKNTEVTLRFARAHVHDESRKDAAPAYWTGQVEASFYGNPSHRIPAESLPAPYSANDADQDAVAPATANGAATATYAARRNTYYMNHSLASSDVGYVPGKSAESQKKGVKSAEGKTALRQIDLNWNRKPDEISRRAPRAKKPKFLGSITLRYCSTVGLIHAGILAEPPNWEVERLTKACGMRTREEHARILSEAKILKFELMSERINGHGAKVVEKREVEIFDLTEGSDS